MITLNIILYIIFAALSLTFFLPTLFLSNKQLEYSYTDDKVYNFLHRSRIVYFISFVLLIVGLFTGLWKVYLIALFIIEAYMLSDPPINKAIRIKLEAAFFMLFTIIIMILNLI
jgi:uncharacterized protein YneF (UPF0154 family)